MNQTPEELATDYVLDRLDPRARAEFEAALLDRPEMAALVRQLEAGLAHHVNALPRHAAPAGSFAAIAARLDRPAAGKGEARARPWAAIARWGLAAIIALSLGTIAVQSLRRSPAGAPRPMVVVVALASRASTQAELTLHGRSQDADARFIQLASLAEQYWEKPGELPVAAPARGPAGRGYAIFDPATNQGFIAIQQLPVPEAGKTYQLWMVDTASGLVHEAGVLPLAGANRGLYFFSIAPAGAEKRGRPDFFVTAEDAAGRPATQPRGEVVLGDRGI